LREIGDELPFAQIALHFHDTAGQAIDNVAAGLELGVTVFDAAAGGLGGCPFAPGAPGNLATETLVAFLTEQGIDTGIAVDAVAAAVAAVRSREQPVGTQHCQD
jgi:isopropylmalate/homocitrate/citramalate synthase